MADFGIQEGLMMRNALLDMKDRSKAKKFDKDYNEYLGGIQSDPENYKPEGDYDPKALNQARYSYAHAQLEDQKVQKGVFEHQREVIDAQYDKTMGFIKQSQAANAVGDVSSEFKAYEMAYENTFDGNDMAISEDNKSYTVTNKLTGKVTTTSFKDSAEMQKSMKAAADFMGQPKAYAQKAIQSRLDNAKANVNQEWTPMKDDKGNVAWMTKQFDNDSGKVEDVYEVNGIRITGEQARKAGFMKGEVRKTFAEAEYKKAGAKAAGLPKGGKETKRVTGSMEKDAEFYMEAYKDENLTKKEAAEMVRTERANVAMHDEMKEYIDSLELMGDAPDEEQSAGIKAKREELMIKYKPVATPEASKKARGLPTEEKATGKVPTENLPKPKGLKEGQTAGKGQYVIKNGKWTLAKK